MKPIKKRVCKKLKNYCKLDFFSLKSGIVRKYILCYILIE